MLTFHEDLTETSLLILRSRPQGRCYYLHLQMRKLRLRDVHCSRTQSPTWAFSLKSVPFTCTLYRLAEIRNGLLSLNTNQRVILGRKRGENEKHTAGQKCDKKRRIEGGTHVLLVENQGGKTTAPLWAHKVLPRGLFSLLTCLQDGQVLLSSLFMYVFHGLIT